MRAKELELALRDILGAIRRTKVQYMVIGALALPVWGRPRATLDMDLMILAPAIPEKLIARLAAIGFVLDAEWEKHNPLLKGVQSRFRRKRLILDILARRDKHHDEAFRRRVKKRHSGMIIAFPSAEDLILLKLRAGRPTDFDDVLGIVQRVGKHLDLRYLSRWARALGITDELSYTIGE